MSKRKRAILWATYIIVSLFLVGTPAPSKGSSFINVEVSFGDITISSAKMAFVINNFKPLFSWWHDNTTSPLEIYSVHFTRLYEYFGADSVLTNASELGGLSYNLASGNWAYTISESTYGVKVSLTLSGLANGASLEFIIHVSELKQPLLYTGKDIAPFRDAWLEVIIKNWQLTTGAKGIALKSEVFEARNDHLVELMSDSSQLGSNLDSLLFLSYPGTSIEKAYYKWVVKADYYNTSLEYLTTKNVGKAFFNETYDPSYSEAVHLWFSYPRVQTVSTIHQDIVLGLFTQEGTPLSFVAGPSFATVASILGLACLVLLCQKNRIKK